MKPTVSESEHRAEARVLRGPQAQNLTRIKTILVPLDLSRVAMHALDYAVSLAKAFRATIHLVHVRTPHDTGDAMSVGNLLRECADSFTFLRDRLSETPGRKSTPFLAENCHLRNGRAYQEICDLARDIGADLIVLATRGQTGLKRIALGSTAERVVRFSPCPVLVARPPAQKGETSFGLVTTEGASVIRKILAPVDFSPCGMEAAKYAARLAEAFDATLCLFHAVEPLPPPVMERVESNLPTYEQASLAHARAEMEALGKLPFLHGVKCEMEVRTGYVVEQICAASGWPGMDLLVTSTHGRSGFNRLVLGSVAEHVVRYADCPVIVVPSHDPAAQTEKVA